MGSIKTWTISVEELARETGGQVKGDGKMVFTRVGTDTRQNLKGRLFIALKGDSFDGHNFAAKAIELGAAAVLVHEWREEWNALSQKVPFVRVPDTLKALQSLARFWRRKMRFFVIGITGSSGKTSTKEYTHALLSKHFRTFAARGSFNNHWGVPITLLEAGPEHSHVIVEMGMNHAGEITKLCSIAEPDVVTVTMVGRAHIGELGSQEAVARAKEEIYLAAPLALQVFNTDNEWTMRMQARSKSKQIKFSSFHPEAEVHLRAQRLSSEGLDIIGHIRDVQKQKWVKVLGRHNTVNLMAASALALAAGMNPEQIWEGLGEIRDSAWGRNQLLKLQSGARVLFDAYNANPESMQALLKNMFEMDVSGQKYLIVGDMRELGTFSDRAHEELGELAGGIGFKGIWYIGQNGELFKKGLNRTNSRAQFQHSSDVVPDLARQFAENLHEGDLVGIKASRGMALERVLQDWPLTEPLGKKP